MFMNEKTKRNFWVMALFLLALPLLVWSCRNAANQAEEKQPEKTEHPADSEHPSEHPEGSEHPDSE
jgi:hypothetical protein